MLITAKMLGWFMASKGAKVGVGALGGSGLIALVLGLHTDVTKRIDHQQIEQKAYVREYVQLTLKPVQVEIENLRRDSTETKEMVKEIRNHLLNKK